MPVCFEKKNDLLVMKVSNPVNQADLLDYVQFMDQIFAQAEKFYLLVDLTELKDIPMKFMLNINLYLKKKDRFVRSYIGASVIVLKNMAMSGLMDTFFILRKPRAPNKVTNDFVEALEFLTTHKKVYYHQNKSLSN